MHQRTALALAVCCTSVVQATCYLRKCHNLSLCIRTQRVAPWKVSHKWRPRCRHRLPSHPMHPVYPPCTPSHGTAAVSPKHLTARSPLPTPVVLPPNLPAPRAPPQHPPSGPVQAHHGGAAHHRGDHRGAHPQAAGGGAARAGRAEWRRVGTGMGIVDGQSAYNGAGVLAYQQRASLSLIGDRERGGVWGHVWEGEERECRTGHVTGVQAVCCLRVGWSRRQVRACEARYGFAARGTLHVLNGVQLRRTRCTAALASVTEERGNAR